MKHEHRYLSCEPASLTLASMGMAAAGAGASLYGQSQQHEAAEQVEQQKADAVNEQITTNRKRATEDYLQTVEDEMLQQAQEKQALAVKEQDLYKAERAGASSAKVAAAESGVVGQYLEAIQADYRRQTDEAAMRLGVNQGNADYQHTRNIEAATTIYNNRSTSVMPYQKNPVKPVDWFGPIFGVAQAGLDMGVRTGALINPLTPSTPSK
ncbi:MAG: hypothetical protein JSR62_03635 [Nitrospira sp.]|nr:hypothetical protein [Nitrospira sp.]